MDRGAWRTTVHRVPKSQTRLTLSLCFPCGSAGKESAYNAGDLGSIPGLGRFPSPVFWPGEFHGLCSPWGLKELDTTERLSLSNRNSQRSARLHCGSEDLTLKELRSGSQEFARQWL